MATHNTTPATQPTGLAAYNALRQQCKALGLASNGSMAVLQVRLAQHHAATTAPTATNTVQAAVAALLPYVAPASVPAPVTATPVGPIAYVPGSWFATARRTVATRRIVRRWFMFASRIPGYGWQPGTAQHTAIVALQTAQPVQVATTQTPAPRPMPVANHVTQPTTTQGANMQATTTQPTAYAVTRYATNGKAMPNVRTFATLALANAYAHTMRNAPVPPTVAAVYASGLATTTVPVAMPTTPAATVAPVQPTIVVAQPVAAPVAKPIPAPVTATVAGPKPVAQAVQVAKPAVYPVAAPVAQTVQNVAALALQTGTLAAYTKACSVLGIAAPANCGQTMRAALQAALRNNPNAPVVVPALPAPVAGTWHATPLQPQRPAASTSPVVTASVPVVVAPVATHPTPPVQVVANAQPVPTVASHTVGQCSATHTHNQWVAALQCVAQAIAIVQGIGGVLGNSVAKALQTAYKAVWLQQRSAWASVPTVPVAQRQAPLYTPVAMPLVPTVAIPPQTPPLAHTATLPNGTTVVRTPVGSGKVVVAVPATQPVAQPVQVATPVTATVVGPVTAPATTLPIGQVVANALAQGTLGALAGACNALGLQCVRNCGATMRAALVAAAQGNTVAQAVVPVMQPAAVQQAPAVVAQNNPGIAASLAVLQPTSPKVGSLGGWQGHSVVSVVRFLGAQGWGFARTAKALAALGVVVAPATIKTQLQAGSSGHGNPAPLTQAQHQTLANAAA